jgi:hypothetical protein
MAEAVTHGSLIVACIVIPAPYGKTLLSKRHLIPCINSIVQRHQTARTPHKLSLVRLDVSYFRTARTCLFQLQPQALSTSTATFSFQVNEVVLLLPSLAQAVPRSEFTTQMALRLNTLVQVLYSMLKRASRQLGRGLLRPLLMQEALPSAH